MEDKDIFETQWEQGLPPENEMKQIRRTIRKRNWRIIIISVVLAAAILLISVFGIVPVVEQLYWNADEYSYGHRSDLEASLYAYTELFNPGYTTAKVNYRHTGFASYDLEIHLFSRTGQESRSVGGSLSRNRLEVDDFINNRTSAQNGFLRKTLPFPTLDQALTDSVRAQLEELPGYIRVEASLSFREDITMEELVAFKEEYPYMWITWIAIRATEPTTEWTPLCGMSPFNYSNPVFDGMYKDYPYFNPSNVHDAGQAEQHFKALLQYSADLAEKGRGIAPYDDWEIYQNALEYVEENGVMSYGVVVMATPEYLLEVMDHELISFVDLTDAWIDLN